MGGTAFAAARRALLARRTWLGLATANGCLCSAAMAATFLIDLSPTAERLMRSGAQFGFAHSMATIACLTLTNAGAKGLERAAWLFLLGSIIVTASLTVAAFAPFAPWRVGGFLGAAACLAGWTTLCFGTRAIPG